MLIETAPDNRKRGANRRIELKETSLFSHKNYRSEDARSKEESALYYLKEGTVHIT
jgi:hypothetical protein